MVSVGTQYSLDLTFDFVFSVTTGVPFRPSLKDIRDFKCGLFNVSWESPTFDSGGGPITAYRVQVRMENEDWRNCSSSSESRSCLFRGLVKKAKYYVRVQAINRIGPSDWSNGSFVAEFSGIFAVVTIIQHQNKSNLNQSRKIAKLSNTQI